jgi:hypothetical protein
MNFYNKMVMVTILLLSVNGSIAMDITCSEAKPEDTEKICNLLEIAREEHTESLVIYPKKCITTKIQASIDEQKLFIAYIAKELVGMKKLYVVPNYQEAATVLQEELNVRAENQIAAGTFDIDHHFTPSSVFPDKTLTEQDIYIYTGTDYTKPQYRGLFINPKLYTYAFDAIKGTVAKLINQNNPHYLHLLYGLVQANGKNNGIEGRTISIEKSFRDFINQLPIEKNKPILFQSYQAQMPVFDAEAPEINKSSIINHIEGSGCVMSYSVSE